ncbi:MAG: alpha/beta fold hydrolase [Bacteroidales bacterium]
MQITSSTNNLSTIRYFRKKRAFILIFSMLTVLLTSSCNSLYHFPEFTNREVHHFEMLEIGGTDQAILINGKSAENPVLVYLHGGPGFPMLPFVPYSESMKKLEEQFTIVYWEQRGTGRSYHSRLNPESMNVNRFVKDTHAVIKYAREKLNVDKVFLWGHSWGTNIGALYASQHPEFLHAYISTGQSVNPFENERLGYEFVKQNANRENNIPALQDLALIDTVPDNYTLDDALTVRKWVYKYGGIVHSNEHKRPYVDVKEITTILLSPVYSLGVRINLLMNPHFSAIALWEDLKNIDLFTQAPEISVPVYFLVGRHDIIVSHVLAEQYYEQLSAPAGKNIVWFEKSAHRPFYEEQEKFMDIMINRVKNETLELFSSE